MGGFRRGGFARGGFARGEFARGAFFITPFKCALSKFAPRKSAPCKSAPSKIVHINSVFFKFAFGTETTKLSDKPVFCANNSNIILMIVGSVML
jgi:hypothetical protein